MKNNPIKLEIEGEEFGFEVVWVHLQDPYRAGAVPYQISIPLDQARQIFDPYDVKPLDKPWSVYVSEQVGDLGAFIFEGYIENIKAILADTSQARWEWVLSTVDEVQQSESTVDIKGRATRFDPKSY